MIKPVHRVMETFRNLTSSYLVKCDKPSKCSCLNTYISLALNSAASFTLSSHQGVSADFDPGTPNHYYLVSWCK